MLQEEKREAQEVKLISLTNFAVVLFYYALTPLSLALRVTLSFSDGTALCHENNQFIISKVPPNTLCRASLCHIHVNRRKRLNNHFIIPQPYCYIVL